ncbi:MAG: N-acetylmuramoyl-L-alanine amidase [bacterium]
MEATIPLHRRGSPPEAVVRGRPGGPLLFGAGLLAIVLLCLRPAETAGSQPADSGASVRTIRHWCQPEYTRVVIETDRHVRYEAHRLPADAAASRPARIYVDLFRTACPPDQAGETDLPEGPVQRLRAALYDPTTTRLVLDLRQVGEHRVFSMTEPERIVLDLWREKKPEKTEPAAAGSAGGASPSAASRAGGIGRPRPLIVLDPGHGGEDPGAVGPSGLQEKDVVLSVARRVSKILADEQEARVQLTRDTDRFLSLEERTSIANARGADLFVSIHANAAPNPRAQGIETYYLDNTTDRAAIRLAALENATAPGRITDLQRILRDLQRNAKVMDSHALARFVQSSLLQGVRGSHARVRDLGAKGNLFYVLMGASMPSILVEISFITNPREEKLLRDPAYQDKVARGIVAGILEYLERSYFPGVMARQGGPEA